MNARQLAFPQPRRDARGREDYMVTASNARAVALMDGWSSWADARLALVGPQGSGKSHLAAIWADGAGARILPARALRASDAPDLATGPLAVEDADRGVDETALFHLWNAMARTGRPLLLTGRAAPADWDVALPDLRSRLASLTPAVIEAPDDAMLSMLLVKLFADRQVAIRPALVGWLLRRMERTHRAAIDVVARLDAAGLERGQPVNETLARDVLGDD
ncbi:chromosomal replication initiator DnaA [Jannaschia sp. LMIT008]|uniref:chromosomal replication initiator DnaA n=1 Tax=Jannaschia maritima TaxID=3032585 RepID=UPI0028128310|nr:chromosomal replication initiator DnaA [Jannaschia sp. LMIT008]